MLETMVMFEKCYDVFRFIFAMGIEKECRFVALNSEIRERHKIVCLGKEKKEL